MNNSFHLTNPTGLLKHSQIRLYLYHDLVKRMKLEEERIAEEKKLSELISKLPSGILVSFDGTDHYKLTDEVYEQVSIKDNLMVLT